MKTYDEQLATYRTRLNANNPRGRELRNRKRRRERAAKAQTNRERRAEFKKSKPVFE